MRTAERLVPPALAALLLALFAGIGPGVKVTTAIHILSFCALGIFVELPEQLASAWFFLLSGDRAQLAARLPRLRRLLAVRRFLTHIVAPCAALSIFASGVYLVARGPFTLTQGWLFWLAALSALGCSKGIVHHNGYLRRVAALCREDELPALQRTLASRLDYALIATELPTFVATLWLALAKPAGLPAALRRLVMSLESVLSPWRAASLCMALCAALVFMGLLPVVRRWSVLA